MKSYYTLSQTHGSRRRTYKGDISKPGDTGRPTRCFSRWQPRNKSTKGVHLLKTTKTGQMPSVIDIAGKTRAEEPPLHPTSRRAALEIARENIHTVQVTSRPGPKTYTMHGPGYYTEECNVLRNNRKKRGPTASQGIP